MMPPCLPIPIYNTSKREKNLFTQTTTSPLRLEYESTHTGKTCEWSCQSLTYKKQAHISFFRSIKQIRLFA